MSNIIDKLTQSRTKAQREVYKLARQEAEGKNVDADKAAAALTAAGLTEADYSELTAFFGRVIELEQKAAKRAEASAAHGKAREALDAHQAESERIKEKRAAEFADLMSRHQTAEAQARQAKAAECELAALRFKFPERFNEKPVDDLDIFTLTCGPNTIGSRDMEAPTLEVDHSTFVRESERRGRIVANAREKANGERRHNMPLDWRGLVTHGLVQELER